MGGRHARVLLATLVVASCGADPPSGPDNRPLDARPETTSLVEALRAAGATVARGEVLPVSSNPFFTVDSTRLDVNGGHVGVWEYSTPGNAERQAAQVSADGYEIRTGPTSLTHVDWIAPPHFYRQSRLIVLYVGRDRGVMTLLEGLLGPQFAGGPPG
jgi:hypothetical protein